MTQRSKRILRLFPLAILALILAMYYRHWTPEHTIKTDHFKILSSASAEDTEKTGELVELLYSKYTDVFGFKDKKLDYKMEMRLFNSREEFRKVNGIYGWAEAIYCYPQCNAYFQKTAVNPYHWMIHEAAHQLNTELAEYNLQLWLNEGIATYFASSKIVNDKMHSGVIDHETYPIWWLNSLMLTENYEEDMANKILIPLRFVVSGRGGPSVNSKFNMYYLEWWSIVHFLMEFEDGKYKEGLKKLVLEGGSVVGFEKYIGKIEDIEKEWYRHLHDQLIYVRKIYYGHRAYQVFKKNKKKEEINN